MKLRVNWEAITEYSLLAFIGCGVWALVVLLAVIGFAMIVNRYPAIINLMSRVAEICK